MGRSASLFFLVIFSVFLGNDIRAEYVDRVLVIKSKRAMFLLKENEIVRAYRVALGRNPVGHKIMEGDRRTPEGVYTVEAKNTKSNFHLSIKISYPNEKDLEQASKMGVKPGGMIMIHGVAKGMERLGIKHRNQDWTDGCIAVTNEEIEEIWNMLTEGTPVVIMP